MIILTMDETELNKKARNTLSQQKGGESYVYPNIPKEITKQNEIYIVDLNADGKFQGNISPEKLSQVLVEKRLLESPCTINLLVSDIVMGNSIAVYASELSHLLKENHQIDTAIKIISNDLNYAAVFLTPPDVVGGKWQVFGLSNIPYGSRTKLSYNNFYSNANKELLWEGENLSNWLDNEVRIIKDVTKLSDELEIGNSYTSGSNKLST